jgi:hypothetical protein
VITYNDGVKNNTTYFYSDKGSTLTYIQDPDNALSLDTVMQYVRTSTSSYSYAGPQWSGASFNNSIGVSVGSTDPSTQYKYLVIRAKQTTTTPFFISLQQITGNATLKIIDLQSVNSAVANKWVDYIFNLSTGTNIPNTFLLLMLMPEKGLVSSTSYINKVFFTNEPSYDISALSPTVTFARTANTIDLVWTAVAGTTSYKILDGNDDIVKENITGLSTSFSNLTPNSTNTYKVVGVNAFAESKKSTVVADTRKQKGDNYEVIDNFQGTTNNGWGTIGSVITVPFSNPATTGINTSSNCAKVVIDINKDNYSGMTNSKERIDVGPNAPYKYLHAKMFRDADNGVFGVTMNARTDITQAQLSLTPQPFAATMVDGTWDDYVFNLQTISSTNKSFFGFYFKPNQTTTTKTSMATVSYIDDVYLSNEIATININTSVFSPSMNNHDNGLVIVEGHTLKFIVTDGSVEVYNAIGRLVENQNNTNSNIHLQTAGVYLIKVKSPLGVRVQKVLIQ